MKVGWECFWLGNVEKVDVKWLGELKKKKFLILIGWMRLYVRFWWGNCVMFMY